MTQDQRNKKAEQLRLAAHIIETGCEWEAQAYSGEWVSSRYSPLKIECDNDPVSVLEHGLDIRIKEWKLPDPPAGRKWHREDWTQEMLPDGWRPLLAGEAREIGDKTGSIIVVVYPACENKANSRWTHTSTTRPLPEPFIQVPEGWRELQDSEKDGRWIEGAKYLCEGKWKHYEDSGCYATSDQRIIVPVAKPKKRVPLGPEDITPGTCIKPSNEYVGWGMVCEVDSSGVHLGEDRHLSFNNLMDNNWSIKRPTDTEWQGCWKLEDEA